MVIAPRFDRFRLPPLIPPLRPLQLFSYRSKRVDVDVRVRSVPLAIRFDLAAESKCIYACTEEKALCTEDGGGWWRRGHNRTSRSLPWLPRPVTRTIKDSKARASEQMVPEPRKRESWREILTREPREEQQAGLGPQKRRRQRGREGRNHTRKRQHRRGAVTCYGRAGDRELRPLRHTLPPTSSLAGASFLRARPPSPTSSSSYSSSPSHSPPRLPAVGRALLPVRSFPTFQTTSRPTTSLPRSRNTVRPSPRRASSWQRRRRVRPRHRALLQTQHQRHRSPLDFLTVTIPPRARVVIGASLCSTRRRRYSSFRFEREVSLPSSNVDRSRSNP